MQQRDRQRLADAEGPDDEVGGAQQGGRARGRVLGAVYFFPGLHKIIDENSPFFESAALARLVRLKAFEAGAPVPFGLDERPALLLAGAGFIIALEVLLPVFALLPRLRPVAGAAMIALHASLALVLRIPFTALAVFAVVFFLPVRWQRSDEEPRPSHASALAWALLLSGVVVAGALGETRGFPFACYPTFARRVPTAIRDVVVEVERAGRRTLLPMDALAPLDVRTAVLGAARTVSTPSKAQRFLEQRARDARFCDALGQTDGVVRVLAVRRDLRTRRGHDGPRRVLFETTPSALCER